MSNARLHKSLHVRQELQASCGFSSQTLHENYNRAHSVGVASHHPLVADEIADDDDRPSVKQASPWKKLSPAPHNQQRVVGRLGSTYGAPKPSKHMLAIDKDQNSINTV